ncbi:hypothetical protein [Cellulomonas sp. WB94]|uniref:hypothetical protein n=1 Tax=Cellulomonas sp. WB94 TaxID=2173174 RepID=UPI0011B1FB08|nr:hypothetical protein [Cellulomonas sp. WB94]
MTDTLMPNGLTLATPALPTPLVPVRELYAGRPAIAVQSETNIDGIRSVAGICNETPLGVVLTVPARWPVTESKVSDVLAPFHEVTGDVEHALFDANRYSGVRRTIGCAPLDVGLVDAQLRAGQRYALTDSPYIPDGDFAALDGTLAQARRTGRPVVAALPISYLWLRNRPRELREAINRGGVPVGLIVEHSGDPMGVQAVVRGLVHVLGADQPVLVLRCDASAVAAVAYGAAGGAIGTLTSLRHLYPLPNPDKKSGRRPARIAVWVPRLMAYMSVEKVADLVQHPDIDQYFVCDCTACNGMRLDRIVTDRHAYEHSIRALTDFAAMRVGSAKSPELQRLALFEAGNAAQFAHQHIESTTGVPLEPPAFIGAWRVAYNEIGA